MGEIAIEAQAISEFLLEAAEEIPLDVWGARCTSPISLVLVAGFEERSVGVLRSAVDLRLPVREVLVGQYSPNIKENSTYVSDVERCAALLGAKLTKFDVTTSGSWLQKAISDAAFELVVDITGLSTRALFGALDALARSHRKAQIAYSEASEYWPKRENWDELSRSLSNPAAIPDAVEDKPWLFGHDHRVELVLDHEGRDGIGRGRALVGFLPFKAARLAAVLAQEEYEEFLFIAGRPRLEANAWRLEALRQINQNIIKDRDVVELSTFGYKNALSNLGSILFDPTQRNLAPLIERFDIHLALLGSKLQDVACWILSSLIPTITVVTSVPSQYFPASFSEGVGKSWVFHFGRPGHGYGKES